MRRTILSLSCFRPRYSNWKLDGVREECTCFSVRCGLCGITRSFQNTYHLFNIGVFGLPGSWSPSIRQPQYLLVFCHFGMGRSKPDLDRTTFRWRVRKTTQENFIFVWLLFLLIPCHRSSLALWLVLRKHAGVCYSPWLPFAEVEASTFPNGLFLDYYTLCCGLMKAARSYLRSSISFIWRPFRRRSVDMEIILCLGLSLNITLRHFYLHPSSTNATK
jgi:hypothetical protein